MKTTTKNFNQNIINSLLIIGLLVLGGGGCSQVNDMVNGNKAVNTNTTANSNTSANTNANNNTAANSNANANTPASPTNSATNTNTQASNNAANTATVTKDGVPLTAEEKVFANNLFGNWSSDTEKVVFSKDEIKFSENGSITATWKYTIVDEKNVEITDERGQKSKATMTFEDNNTKLHWVDKMGDFRYKREASKP